MKRFGLVLWIAAAPFGTLANMAYASPERIVEQHGRTFELDAGAWFQRDGSKLYPVVPDVVSARFIPEIATFDEFLRTLAADGSAGTRELSRLAELRVNRLGIYDLALAPGQDPIEIAALIEGTGLARYAEVSTFGEFVATPNDPRFPDQYALNNTGQSGGTVDADIDAPEAWDIETGDPSIIVAEIDSGTDIDHVDLQGNLWKNPGELPANGADDDGNGFVDDYDGWDFEGNDGDPRSSNGHGTQVAGIVTARTNNSTGVSGVAGGFGAGGVRLMPVKVGTAAPNGAVVDDAIIYAADNGARVETMSLSVGQTQAIEDALNYAYNQKGVFINCAAGNNTGSVSYPASNANVMAVAASDRFDQRASYSNSGPEIEVAAPGSDILSTGLSNSYVSGSGTSFASPHVAGTAALILSYNSTRTNVEVRQTLKDSADDIGPAGYDTGTGYGRINAQRALNMTPAPVVGVKDYPLADILVKGTLSGSFANTTVSDDVYESITEINEPSSGNPKKRRSLLEHKWRFGVTGGSQVFFRVEAYRTSNSEGDDFRFAYSTDDVTYTDMLTVAKSSDDDQTQSFLMPAGASGTVYVRAVDTDRTLGRSSKDKVSVDVVYFESLP